MRKQPEATGTSARSSSRRSLTVGPPIAPREKAKHRKGRFTRAEVARELHVAKTTVYAWQQKGLLVAERIEGVDYFDRAAILRFKIELASRVTTHEKRAALSAEGAGELAARAFELLSSGTPAAELVTRLRITPDVALDFVDKYNRLADAAVSRPSSGAQRCAHAGGCDAPARFCGEHATPAKPPVAPTSRA